MEAEERPVKKRKISGDDQVVTADESEIVLQDVDNSTSENPTTGSEGFNYHADQGQFDPSEDIEVVEDFSEGLPAPELVAPFVETTEPNGPPMSKNQQKKLRKKIEWEAKRDERKVKRKAQTIAKRERKREERNQLAENGDLPVAPQFKKTRAVQLPVTILIDCDFDDLMRDPERVSLAAQITRSYSDTRHSMFRAHLAVCSFTGNLRERFDNVLSHYKGWKGVRFLDCDFVEAAAKAKEWMLQPGQGGKLAGSFSSLATEDEEHQRLLEEQGEVVYLTSEADDVLNELKPYSTYIIGGLVDKNREKGICYKRATKRGVRTARLPIGEFMDMQSRKVLATNHVNEIMLKWLECDDWGEAFVKAIPKRKGGTLKGADGDDEVNNEDVVP